MRPLSRSILAAAIAAGLAAPPASARVGVTSVTNGEPLGQPPAEAERILRVGIDIQASERVTTRASDRAHVVFLDGTALTVGPNSVLVIDKYVYDPDRKVGEMALSTTKGVFRFVGGSISKNSEVVVTTPTATIGIRGGIATFEVAESGATRANFLYGDSMRVTNQGVTQIATRHGSQINAAHGAPPTPPAILPRVPSTQAFERAPTTSPAPIAARPVTQTAVNQKIVQTDVAQQLVTRTTTTPVVSATPATTIAINTALDQSGLATFNSRVAPSQMPAAPRFNPRGPGQGGPDSDGPGAGPKNQPRKAGPPPTPPVPKPPRTVGDPGPRNPRPVLPQFVQNQPQKPKGR